MTLLSQISRREIIGSVLLIAICVLPFFTLASTKKIYVDAKASGSENGSSTHPYKTIKEALKHTKNNTEVHIAKGTYQENIEIPSGTKLFGSDKNDVILKGKNDDDPVVTMHNKTELNKVTVKKGGVGIEIDDNDKASIIECIIKENKKEGIKIKKASVNDQKKVSITDSIIKENGRNGIFSEKRRLVLENNDVINNYGDGVGIMPGSKAWIKGNKIKDNKGSGMRINIDGSEIWTKSNTYRDNDREGIEIDSFGGTGRIDINKSKFWENKRWAIARIQKSGSTNAWNGVTIQENNEFIETKTGNVSPVIRVK